MRILQCLWCFSFVCAAAEHRGEVTFGGLPVPGAAIAASRGAQKIAAITDQRGTYMFPDLAEGQWSMEVTMSGFAPARKDIVVSAAAPASVWDLHMLKLDEIKAQPAPSQQATLKATPASQAAAPSSAFANLEPQELAQRAADGFLINGTANNAAASPFSLSNAFGNNRRGQRSRYNGNLGFILDNSSLDARPFSLTGQDTPRPDFGRFQGLASFGGPIRVPPILRNGPNVTVTYQWTHNRNVSNQSSLVPTAQQRNGELQVPVLDPTSGQPFPGNVIPASRISPQAKALLQLYPLPNFGANPRYNFQTALVGATHQDNLQSRFNQSLRRKDRLTGNVAWQSTRSDDTNLFGFLSTSNISGVNAGLNWIHSFHSRLYSVLGVQFSRLSSETNPFFGHRSNVSALAGITGNNQDPINWGPPSLSFSGGIAGLSDSIYALNHNQTTGVSIETGWSHGSHNFVFGSDLRKQQFNILSQEDPRGTFAFTGASTGGSDFGGFLLGIPDTSSLAFGNADKYFRATSADVYARDDWRLSTGLTLNIGLRWEYSSPMSEIYGRLVNLGIAPGFTSATPITGNGLIRPDRNNFAPRLAFAWRPQAASSMVIRGGYGIYYDTSVYQPIATQMAQQYPLSTSLRIQNSPENPLTLASGFPVGSAITRNTFAVDPDLRIGYAQNWQMSVQRDLPASLVLIANYLGVKGTRAQQQLLPNTVPIGADNPCPACPAGFAYLTSNGDSIRHSAQVELRRRLRAGFTSTLQYTFAKAIDNAALGGRDQGGALIAQNWLDLRSERGLSYFDQRHLASVTMQFTSGMGRAGGTLLGGWWGLLLKEWTVTSQITAGTGLPLTPVYFRAVQGTGVVGSIRPDYTGAPLFAAPAGLNLNPASYTQPASGHWGNAGRNSITGPSQFTLKTSLGRTFRLSGDRLSLDARVDLTNALNHPVFPSWNTITNSSQFGLPNPANPMRTVQTTVRLRF